VSAYKFWRFSVLKNNGADTVQFQDLRLCAYPHGLDILLPQHNRVKNVFISELTGDLGTRNFSGAAAENTQHSITVETFEPEIVEWYTLTASGVTAPKTWQLEFSENGAFWNLAHLEHAQTNWGSNEARPFVAHLHELNLNIQGSNAAPSFFANVYDLASGELIIRKQTFTNDCHFLMPDATPVCVTVAQTFGTAWQKRIYYRAGALVMPTNPIATPYYFRTRRAGISGLTEPVWQLDPEVLTSDGSCEFELVERFNAPISHAPIIPVRKL
jgi:hypothetical protein